MGSKPELDKLQYHVFKHIQNTLGLDCINELDVLKGELEELRKQLTQCRTDLEESKFTNKAKKLFSCGRAGLKPKKKRKYTKKRKHTKKRKTRRKTKKR